MDHLTAKLAEEGLLLETFGGGDNLYVVQATSWMDKIWDNDSDHYHRVLCVSLDNYERYPLTVRWDDNVSRSTYVKNADGDTVCFWCEMAELGPASMHKEMQELYLVARSKAQNSDDIDAVWTSMAQMFYDEKCACGAPKPAKR